MSFKGLMIMFGMMLLFIYQPFIVLLLSPIIAGYIMNKVENGGKK